MAVSKKAAAPVKSAKAKVGPARVAKAAPAKVAPKKAPAKAAQKSAPTTGTVELSIDMLTQLRAAHALIGDFLNGFQDTPPFDGGTKVEADEPADDEEDENSAIDARRTELEGMSHAALKKLAKAAEFDPKDIKAASVEQLVENLLEVEFGDSEDADDDDEDAEGESDAEETEDGEEDSDDEEEDEDEEDSGEDDYSREDLLEMSLSDLKNLAVQLGKADSKADLKGQDKDTIADLILEDDEEAGEDDEDEEGGYYTREDYEKMSITELKALADQCGISYKKTVKAADLITELEAYEGDEEEDE